MTPKIEFVEHKIRIRQAMKAIDQFDKTRDYEQAKEAAMTLLAEARLLALAYGSWITDREAQ